MLHFTQEALNDIEDAVLWYEEQRVGLSHDFELCLEAGISEVVRLAETFQFKYKNVRVVYIKRFPFGIHYIAEPKRIIIVGVFHTSRSPRKWNRKR